MKAKKWNALIDLGKMESRTDFDCVDEEEALEHTAEMIATHVRAQDASYWVHCVKELNGKPVDRELEAKVLDNMARRGLRPWIARFVDERRKKGITSVTAPKKKAVKLLKT
jgi:hypothetical protein